MKTYIVMSGSFVSAWIKHGDTNDFQEAVLLRERALRTCASVYIFRNVKLIVTEEEVLL